MTLLIDHRNYTPLDLMGIAGTVTKLCVIGMYVPYGMEIIHVTYATCFRENMGQAMLVSFELLSPYGLDYLHLMRTWEEHVMEGWIGRHLASERSLSHGGVTNGGG